MTFAPELPSRLSLTDNFALFAPEAEVSLEAAVEMISGAIQYCRASRIDGLLIDARKLHGFPPPSVTDRYWFIRRWAEESAGQVVLSFIQRPEMIDPEQIGITIAANAGLIANVFENKDDARAWLTENISK